jgi:hypothetical protein
MTREKMVKRSWKPYMEIEYKNARMKEGIICLLVGVNFDDEEMELQPIDKIYVQKTFFTAISCCNIPKKQLKIAAKDGKIIKDEIPNLDKKSIQDFHNTETGNIDRRW